MKAKDLLRNPAHWCQGEMARDESGQPCRVRSYEAMKFCLAGALAKCYEENEMFKILEKVQAVIKKKLNTKWEYNSLSLFNDNPTRSHAEVLEVLELADV